MIDGKRIGVVVPAHNEAPQIGRVITTIPDYVDEIIVVDDASTDGTSAVLSGLSGRLSRPIRLVHHQHNQGVGAAIRSGYELALERSLDVVAVMAGDGQMDPDDLARVIEPTIDGSGDYVKGDRLAGGTKPASMPFVRYAGVKALTALTRLVTGYERLSDSQSGYTAISRDCLRLLPLHKLYPRYGYPNHLLILLAQQGQRVVDVPVRAVYGQGETSDMKLIPLVPRLMLLLAKGLVVRR